MVSPSFSHGRMWWASHQPLRVRQGLSLDPQDTIQQLTGGAVLVTTSHDETGAGRQQVLDRNWEVCSQSVPTGTTIRVDTQIDFGAVKLEESC
ncbi:MAG: hypothetical protein ACRDRK_10630 [Pseudonocardia sp.]